ncbi:CU044_5270 family protein [Nonomuraea guangzhouensis]|uniref:CU044_5270 family protein n=1 Tax=Nonomuraea guangzhouensis TaxID=1291555 RepID=A0ABW4GR99_9ACTN|nr:CU044_5270 family protein [Nonomuraea guangzhouensis]
MTNDHVVAALKPSALDEVALDEVTALDSDAKIAAIVATPRPAPAVRRHRALRMPLPLIASVVVAVVAAVMIPLFAGANDQRRLTPPNHAGTAVPFDARTFLLAGAEHVAAVRESVSGKYWHLKTRRCRTGVQRPMASVDNPPSSRPSGLPYRFTACETMEQWTSRSGFVRTVIGLDPKVSFDTPGDESNWRADGAPALTQRLGYTEDNGQSFTKWGLDGNHMGFDQLTNLPSDPSALRNVIAKSAVGRPQGSALDSFLWRFAPDLFAQPITQKTRAGLYRMLAQINGVRIVSSTFDTEGHPVVVLARSQPVRASAAGPIHKIEDRLVFRQDTYEFISSQFDPDRNAIVDEQMIAEWTDVLGPRQGQRGHD